MIKKTLDNEILWQIHALAIEKNLHFEKWFEDEEMMLQSIPVTIHELLTVLPKTLLDPRPGVNKFYCIGTMWYSRAKVWQASYECLDETEHRDIYKAQTAPELVDALGKLLIKIIKEGWLG